MVTRQTLVVVGVVLLATLAVVVPAVSAGSVGTVDAAQTADESATTLAVEAQTGANATAENETADESEFGDQMAAFMQSNAAQVDDSVDNGMWEAAFERANESKRARMAQSRVESLNDRVAELTERNRTLAQQYENRTISYGEYVAATAHLNGRMEALKDGVNGTARAAQRAGVNVTALDELRTNARNLTGPEVAGIARGLVSGDRGPPADVPGRGPPGENATERPGAGPDEAPGSEEAPGVNATRGGANESRNAPDGTRGVGNATGGPDSDGSNTGGEAGNATRGPAANGNGTGGDGGQGASGPDDGGKAGDDGDERGSDGDGRGSDGDRAGGNGDGGQSGDGDGPGGGPAAVVWRVTLITG